MLFTFIVVLTKLLKFQEKGDLALVMEILFCGMITSRVRELYAIMLIMFTSCKWKKGVIDTWRNGIRLLQTIYNPNNEED